jgi:hypothetical protein
MPKQLCRKGWKFMTIIQMILMFVLGVSFHAKPLVACSITGDTSANSTLTDPLAKVLKSQRTCPSTVLELRTALTAAGGTLNSTMVANRGFHNPTKGSFSFFETVTFDQSSNADLFFGHFTTPVDAATLGLDQDPLNSGLLIEAIAWDSKKEVYNFYELVSTPNGSQWHFRGDSTHIWDDTKNVHISPAQNPFGANLRCSGCHLAGGPIMKELKAPHDSWWSANRPLPLGGRMPDANMADVMSALKDAEHLSNEVQLGYNKLFQGSAYKRHVLKNPIAALKPFFCAEEINLESASEPFAETPSDFIIPTSGFIDQRLTNDHSPVLKISKNAYESALKSLKSRFPETHNLDADHPWLTPVKGFSDQERIKILLNSGLVSPHLIKAVLSIDFKNPVFSSQRCSLLRFVPKSWDRFQDSFTTNLENSGLPNAIQLATLINLSAGELDQLVATQTTQHLVELQSKLNQDPVAALKTLNKLREDVRTSAISKNPRGQILEPGFRVIFPTFSP